MSQFKQGCEHQADRSTCPFHHSVCGCKIVDDSYDPGATDDVMPDLQISYCPRHSPERVSRLEGALRKIATAPTHHPNANIEDLKMLAQEALRMRK